MSKKTKAGLIPRNIVGSGSSFLGNLTNTDLVQGLSQGIVDIIGLPSARGGRPDIAAEHSQIRLPHSSAGISQLSSDILGYEPESLKAKNFPEKVLHSASSGLGFLGSQGALNVGGKGIAKLAGRELAGSTASQAAASLKLPSSVQLFAGIGGQSGFEKVFNRLNKVKIPANNLSTMAAEAEKGFYDTERELGSKIPVDVKPFEKDVFKLQDRIGKDKKLSSLEKQELLLKSEEFLSDAASGKVNASDISQWRKDLNFLISKERGVVKDYYKAIRTPIVNILKETEKNNPEWYSSLKSGDQLHAAQNFGKTFKDMVNYFPRVGKILDNPIAYFLASAGPSVLYKGVPGLGYGVAATAGGMAAKKIAKVAPFLFSGPAPRHVLLKASEEVIKNNIPAAMREYAKLNSMASKWEAKHKEKGVKKNSNQRLIPVQI